MLRSPLRTISEIAAREIVPFFHLARLNVMSEPMTPADREELCKLYSELHLACGRASAALRLAEHWDAPEEKLLARFQIEEYRAAAIWKRIVALRDPSTD